MAAAAVFVALSAGSISLAALNTRGVGPRQSSLPDACLSDGAIQGTPGDDTLKGTPGDDVISGGGGDDVIKGKGGNDVICAGGGDDAVKAGNGNDVVLGGGGDDDVRGGPGDDTLTGGGGFDTLDGGVDTDECVGEIETNCEEATPTPSPSASPTATPTATPTVTPTPPTNTPKPDKRNVPPVAAANNYSTDEDQSLNVPAPGVLGNDSDADGEPITATLVTQAANGDVTLQPNGSFSYVPDPDFNGSDSFTYSANDAQVSSIPATVTIDVISVGDAPTATAQSVSGDEDTPEVISLFGADVDGPAPSVFKITSLAADGDLRDGSGVGGHRILPGELPYTLTGSQVTYVPDPNFFGSDDFDFKANDGSLDSASAAVSIVVAAVNDAPTDVALSNSSVDEESPAGTTVGSLSATDPDAGDIHGFTLVAGAGDADNARFQIAGGVLKTLEVFDFETQGPFSVRIRTTDAAGAAFEKQFAVTLNNVNDQPVVPDATYSLPENSANGTAVGTPAVNDQDAAQAHSWSITAGNSDTAFAINSSTGAITVADSTVLDFEDVQQWVLTVRAEDNGSPAKAGTGSVTINLTNVNETPTDIGITGTSVAENEPAGTAVGGLSAEDPDASDNHTFTLVSGTGDGDNGKFQIDNGFLETDQVFDFENPTHPFSVRIRTTDTGGLQHEEVFSISVTNANDAPVMSAATFALDENSPNGTAVGTASATDEDAGQTRTYAITGGNALGAFQIDSSTGAVTVADASDLDFETNPTFGLSVTATDNGTPAKDDTDTITVNLNNLNENPVVNAATLSLPENSPNGTSVGTVTASDPDAGQTRTWAITGGNTGGAFQINASNGEITVADVNDVDFETNPTFSLTVEATDNGTPPLTDTETVTVNLTNVNENPTDLALSNSSVAENLGAGSTVGSLSTADPDAGDTHSYVLAAGAGDADNARFQVDNGVLKTAETFDFESQGPFSVRIRTTDAGSLQYEEAFSIAVTNVNEAPTVTPATFGIDENSANGTSVGTVGVTDPETAQTHAWSITGGNANGAFSIGSSSGEITVANAGALNYEATPTFALTVRAEDSGSPALADTETITVNLNDVNDNPVVNAATLSVAENTANGGAVGTVTATDADLPAQTLTLAITGGNTGGAFQINPSTGEITVADVGDVDFETNPSFSLTVEATDDGTPNRSGSNTITVNLTNVNEKPAITAPATIGAQHGVAKTLSGISVADPDSGSSNITMTLGVLEGTLAVDDTVLNGLVAGDVTGNGTDAVTLTAAQSKINNTLAAAGGLVYTSDGGFSGLSDTLAIATTDLGNTGSGGAQADAANVTIQFNTPPVATDQTVSTNEDTEKTITLAGTDAENNPLTFKITSLPAAGKLHEGTSSAGTEITAGALPYTLPSDKVTYVPPANQNGLSLETFGFKANDGSTDSTAAGIVTVDVSAVDDPSVAVDDAYTVLEDSGATALLVRTNDTDIDSPQETIASVTQPANGSVAIILSNSRVQYTPSANYCNNPPTIPVDTFTYTLAGGSVGTVNVTVTCVDDLPVAVNDSKTMNEDASSAAATTIDVLGNDTDQDGGPKTIESKTNGTNGTVAITNSGADLTYTPAANYCNTQTGGTPDTFTYTLNGGSIGTVSVTVTCVDDAPVAVNDAATVLEDAAATTINVLGNDTDIDGGPKFIDLKTNSANGGTVAITNSGADLTYAPAANYCNDPELQPAGGTLSETFTYTLNGTPASVGTVTMTVTCVNDPPTADTETFNGTDSALSNVKFDNGTSFSGLKVAPATLHNVLVGDTDIEGNTITLIAGADCTGTGPFTCLTDGYDPDGAGGPHPVERGTVTLETDGDFHYTPPAGHVGSDSFDYRVSDGQAANSEATGTVNINVAGPTTWFVDDSASAGGKGTSSAPFQGFGPLTTSGGSNHLDEANENIFVYEGTYPTGIVLENGQRLLGHPHSLDVSDTAGRTHTDLVSGAGAAPAISHSGNAVVTLGSGNELQDLALGNGSTALSGTNVGTATVRDTSINTDGKALDVNGGQLDMVFTTVSSTGSGSEAIKLNNATGTFTAPAGSLQNAANAVVDISGAAQDFTYGGSISDGAGKVISITGTTGGTKDFNGPVTGSSGGTITDPRINLTNNAGSVIRFDNDVSLDTTTAPALNAAGGGTLHMPSDDNVLTTTTGTPLKVVNTTIGAGDLIFDSISANGAANGIVLDNTGSTGNLQVTGNPGADTNEGGTIAATSGGDASTNQCTKPAGQPAGIGILLKDTNGVILNDMLISGSSNFGLLAHDVNGFTLDDSTFSGTHGTNEGQDEGSSMFCDLTGWATISDSEIFGGYENSLTVTNAGGTLNRLTVSNTDLATSTAGVADDAFQASSTGNAVFNITVNGASSFTRAGGDLFQYAPGGTSTGDLVLQNNAFSNNFATISAGGGGVTLNPGGGGSNVNVTYNVSNNTFRDARGNALTLTTGGPGSSGTTGTYSGTVVNNTFGVPNVAGSAASDSANGIRLLHTGNGTHTLSITGNTIQNYTSNGIRLVANDGTPTLRATVLGNTINQPGPTAFSGISIEPGTSISQATMCLDLGTVASQNAVSTGDPSNANDINVIPRGTSTLNLPGYVGPLNGSSAATAVQSFLAPRNSGDGVPTIFASSAGTISYTGTGMNCL